MAVKSKKRVSRNIIGERVREARRRSDPPMTQDQLAGRLAGEGVQLDRVALAKVEGGLRSTFDFEVKGLAKVLKVDANWLLGIDTSVRKATSRAKSDVANKLVSMFLHDLSRKICASLELSGRAYQPLGGSRKAPGRGGGVAASRHAWVGSAAGGARGNRPAVRPAWKDTINTEVVRECWPR
jgi:hypothetical protein